MPPLTRAEARRIDQFAIEAGIPGVVLMENAAINTAAVILDQLETARGGPHGARVGILCGGGNNGGDGYAIARHLQIRGCAVTLFAVSDPDRLRGDAAINHAVCRNLGFDIRPVLTDEQLVKELPHWDSAHLLVDALLGTGFEGPMRPHMARVIEAVNRRDRPFVVAVDVPSGLDCDTGEASPATVRADRTVTFVATKTGFANPSATPYLGRVDIAGIGVPPQVVQRALTAKNPIPARREAST